CDRSVKRRAHGRGAGAGVEFQNTAVAFNTRQFIGGVCRRLISQMRQEGAPLRKSEKQSEEADDGMVQHSQGAASLRGRDPSLSFVRNGRSLSSEICARPSIRGFPAPYSFGAGGCSRAPSSARSALTTRSNSRSNFALSRSQPVKSAARRDLPPARE